MRLHCFSLMTLYMLNLLFTILLLFYSGIFTSGRNSKLFISAIISTIILFYFYIIFVILLITIKTCTYIYFQVKLLQIANTLLLHFHFDNIHNSTLLALINMVFLYIFLYAIYYIYFDKFIVKFLLTLHIFTFIMNLFLLSRNIFTIFVFWEFLGLLSFCLISYNWYRLHALKGAFRSITLGKGGDFLILTGYTYLINIFGELTLSHTYLALFAEYRLAQYIIFLLVLGASSKSTQLGLHIWLPDAMEGPIPVSALIHAATLVISGIILITPFKDIVVFHINIVHVFLLWGILTLIFLGGSILSNFDLKRFIAFSTILQIGISGVLLITTHTALAFSYFSYHMLYKSTLFINLGIWIHTFYNIQDIRTILWDGVQMNISSKANITLVLLNSLSFWFSTGFYIKEHLLTSSTYQQQSSFIFEILLFILLMILIGSLYNIFLLLYINFYTSTNFLNCTSYLIYDTEVVVVLLLLSTLLTVFSGNFFLNILLDVGFNNFEYSFTQFLFDLNVLIILSTIYFLYIFYNTPRISIFHFDTCLYIYNYLFSILYTILTLLCKTIFYAFNLHVILVNYFFQSNSNGWRDLPIILALIMLY